MTAVMIWTLISLLSANHLLVSKRPSCHVSVAFALDCNNNMSDELISVIDVAASLGKRKQYIFKILGRLGIESKKQKSSDARGQQIAYITTEGYDRIKEYLSSASEESDSSIVQPDVGGVFYLIQLEPEHDPGRFKVGFATSIEERLRAHKTAAPFSKVLKTWPCKSLWEKTAIDCVSQGCTRLHTEVFRTDSIEQVLSRCDAFFSLMPNQTEDD